MSNYLVIPDGKFQMFLPTSFTIKAGYSDENCMMNNEMKLTH